MPALLPVPSTLRVKFSGIYGSVPWACLFHWQYAGGTPGSSTITQLCAGFRSAWVAQIVPASNVIVRLTHTEAWDLNAPDGAYGSDTTQAAGTRTGQALPANVAVCGTWRVVYRWRGGHPRTYFPIANAPDVTSAHLWDPTALATFSNAMGAFLTAMNGVSSGAISGSLICVRRQHTPVRGQPPVNYDPPLRLPIIGYLVDSRVDSQRRRLGKDLPT